MVIMTLNSPQLTPIYLETGGGLMRKSKDRIYTLEDLDILFNDISKRDLYILLYKGDYAFYSLLIKWWTKSKYSHIEFYLTAPKTKEDPDGLNEHGRFIGISGEQNVRVADYTSEKTLRENPKWDYFKIPDEHKDAFIKALIQVYNRTKGYKYDWKGIITSHIFGRKVDDSDKYTCSEWTMEVIDTAMDIIYPKWYRIFSPEDVYKVIQDKIVKNKE